MISDELQLAIDEHVRSTIASWRKPDEIDVAALRRIVGPALTRARDRDQSRSRRVS